MPMHDWTRVDCGLYHSFRQDWGVELKRTLNRGLLPPGLYATTPMPPPAEPDEPECTTYARKANRVHVLHESGEVVAAIEIVSPGNKDSRNAVSAFITTAVDYVRRGVNLLLIDLFPPTPHDSRGLLRLIWDELSAAPSAPLPTHRSLVVASFDAANGSDVYVEPLAVGMPLIDMPLFLAPDRCVIAPLEATYMAAWAALPPLIRDRVQPPA